MQGFEGLLALLAAIIGLIAALVNRKKIVVHKYETPSKSSDEDFDEKHVTKPRKIIKKRVSLRRRFKKFLLSSVGSFASLMVVGATLDFPVIFTNFMILVSFVLFILASYHLIAIFLIILKRIFKSMWT